MIIEIFTDGACRGNPGPGGYGIILRSPSYPEKEVSAGYNHTTNNRMELMAVIEGLKQVKRPDAEITIYSDSSYVVDSITKGWVFGWHKKGFAGKKNADLWRMYLPLHQKFKPKFVWIKGHNNHPENERCDRLAVNAASKPNLPEDSGYVQQDESSALL